jgi:CO/xanthine dehydrogenase FAD-binding subunit
MRLVRPSAARRPEPRRPRRIDGERRRAVGATTGRPRSPATSASIRSCAQALPFVGHFVTRNRGTVGGSIAHADGAAELPLCLVALGGSSSSTARTAGARSRRGVLRHALLTTLAPGELVVETVWPLAAAGEASAFEELALRAGDFAQSMVAVVLRRDAGGIVSSVASRRRGDRPPDRLREVEALLVGSSGAEARPRRGARRAARRPAGSIHASAALPPRAHRARSSAGDRAGRRDRDRAHGQRPPRRERRSSRVSC